MSVINKMLRDLDRRNAPEVRGPRGAGSPFRGSVPSLSVDIPDPRRPSRMRWVAWGVAVLAAGAAAYWMDDILRPWVPKYAVPQVKPIAASTEAAPKDAAAAPAGGATVTAAPTNALPTVPPAAAASPVPAPVAVGAPPPVVVAPQATTSAPAGTNPAAATNPNGNKPPVTVSAGAAQPQVQSASAPMAPAPNVSAPQKPVAPVAPGNAAPQPQTPSAASTVAPGTQAGVKPAAPAAAPALAPSPAPPMTPSPAPKPVSGAIQPVGPAPQVLRPATTPAQTTAVAGAASTATATVGATPPVTAASASGASGAVASTASTSGASAQDAVQRQQQAVRDAVTQAQNLWNAGSRDAAMDLLQQAVATAERVGGGPVAGKALLLPLVRELTRMQLADGRASAALDLLARLEPLMNGEPDLWAVRANAAQRLGRHVDSLQAYRTALQSRPNEQRWLLGAAVSLAALGQTANANEMAEKARQQGPISRDVLTYLRQVGVQVRD